MFKWFGLDVLLGNIIRFLYNLQVFESAESCAYTEKESDD